MTGEGPPRISRRSLLRGVGAAGAAAAVGAVGLPAGAEAPPAIQPTSRSTTRVVYAQLTADEAELLETIADQVYAAKGLKRPVLAVVDGKEELAEAVGQATEQAEKAQG